MGRPMTDADRLEAYVREILGGRKIAPGLREVLYALLDVPRVRARFPSLGTEEIRAVADRFVAAEPGSPAPRGRRIA